jgi:hypothetical protein
LVKEAARRAEKAKKDKEKGKTPSSTTITNYPTTIQAIPPLEDK